MPKVPASKHAKVASIVRQYPAEFSSTPRGDLYCKLCDVAVKHDKMFYVDSHRKSHRHSSKLTSSSSSTLLQPFLDRGNFTADVTKAFLAADIPLNKLEHPALRNLFSSMGRACPSISSCRQLIPELYLIEKQRVKPKVEDKKILLIVD